MASCEENGLQQESSCRDFTGRREHVKEGVKKGSQNYAGDWGWIMELGSSPMFIRMSRALSNNCPLPVPTSTVQYHWQWMIISLSSAPGVLREPLGELQFYSDVELLPVGWSEWWWMSENSIGC